MNIWILDSESGVLLLYKPYIELMINEDLVSGLLAALNQFSVFELGQSLESLEMVGLRWVYLEDKEANLLFIAADNKDVSADILNARLDVIRQSFISEYIEDKKNWRENWDSNTEKFKPFKKVIDEYYMQWKQAESITTIAEFFDILGIYQQVLNLTLNFTDPTISNKKKDRILRRIEYLFTRFKNSEEVKNEPELNKLDFSMESGINVININPNNAEMITVERKLTELLRKIIYIIKNELGIAKSVQFFINENVFDYIFNNYLHLKELNLDKFLLELFLRK
ncbi:MAG: hypothetical protein BAJALOKI2v1_240032 [Promethearchaeota archaeon]|nr:MAG: hypothetical protein BAJALOKI2v1_240032 [Candidatus Lokiarchaeota archaeon]